MAEEMKQELSAEEAEQLALVENDRDALSALVDDLSGHSRRKRQMAAHVMLLVAQREPELLSEFIPDLIDALYRPEAQTRWEILDALTLLVPEHAKEIGAAFDGAEAALFDDLSSILHFSAFRLLVTWGATERGRSKKVWPILDEAIQCYHGDLEYRVVFMSSPRARSRAASLPSLPAVCSSMPRTARAAISRRVLLRFTTCLSSASNLRSLKSALAWWRKPTNPKTTRSNRWPTT